ncbi:MAG: hypothetical protein EKK48_09705 [Candidatus Melainabacteria bacterium]|nr:MAG: hypothetical protein EKK48_09705 [Candidatus Melainabacteria bacterium]
MGNPSRVSLTERTTTQPVAADIQSDPEDRLRSEVFTPQDRKAMSTPELMKKLDDIISNLEKASNYVAGGDMAAATRAYSTAIRSAETVDQVAVARERRNIKEALKDADLSPQERKELLQRDADLHVLERSRGFSLANYALVLIRHGDQFNGAKLLVRAQELDPEMNSDLNFKRHLKEAFEDGENSKRVRTAKPSDELPSGFPQPTIPEDMQLALYKPGQPAKPAQPGLAPQTFAPQQPQTFAPQQPQTFAPQQPQTFAPQQQFVPPRPGQPAPQQPTYAAPYDVQPLQRQPGGPTYEAPIATTPGDMTAGRFSKLDAQNHTPIEVAALLFAKVVNAKAMSPEVFQQFLQTIDNADSGMSPRIQPYIQKQHEALKAIATFATANPQIVNAIAALDQSAVALMERMPKEQQMAAAQLFSQIDRVGTAQERANAQAQLIALNPEFKQLLQQRDQIMGPQLLQLIFNNAQLQTAIEKQFQNKDNQAEFNQAAVTRFTFALALEKAGRIEEAKTMMAEAMALNNSRDAAQNAYWQKTAERFGLTASTPTDTVHPLKDTKQPVLNPNGSAEEQIFFQLDKFKEAIARGGNPSTVFSQMKPDFEKAISKADAEFETTMKKIPALEKLSAELNAQLTPEKIAKAQEFGRAIIEEKEKMTAPVLEAARKFQDPALPDSERAALRQYLTQTAPRFVSLNDQFESLTSKEFLVKFNQTLKDEQEMVAATKGRFMSRFFTALCAEQAGDMSTAATKFVEGMAAIPATYQKAFFSNKEVEALAQKIGFNANQLPIAADALLLRSDPPRETSKTNRETIAGVSDENQGYRPEQVINQAKQMLRTEGMTAATKKQFEDGIRIADSLYTEKDTADATKLVSWLKSGKKDNGQALTVPEREEIHALLNNTFARATIGIQLRAQYAQLLTEYKQFDSAQKMYLERIKLSDQLPLQLFRDELEQLSVDMRNPNIKRMNQADLGVMFEQIAGSTSSKDDGLLYMPISSRKTAACFYMSGRDPETPGIFKPDQAIMMINDTRAAELRLYNIDLTKNPKADPQLLSMAKDFSQFASEKLKEDKKQWDTYWSNGIIDATAGVVAVTVASYLASLALRRPIFKFALTAEKAAITAEGAALATQRTLSLGGKVAIGTTAFGSAVGTRALLHHQATGETEDFSTSLIHATAGVAGIGGIYATRGAVNRFLFRGATEEGALLRVVETHGKVAEGAAAGSGKILKVEQLSEFYARANIRLPKETVEWMAKNKDLVVATGRTVDAAVFANCKLGLNAAQSATLARHLAPLAPLAEATAEGTAAASTPFLTRLGQNTMGGIKNVVNPFTKLDLATASTGQLAVRSMYGNWASASGGLFALESVRSLDRDINPATGQKYSYAESLMRANYQSLENNTLTRGFLLGNGALIFGGMPVGSLPLNFYAKEASLFGRVKGMATAPLKTNGFGATLRGASITEKGWQAGHLGFMSFVYDYDALQKLMVGRAQSAERGRLLEQNGRPVENLEPPKPKGLEVPKLGSGDGPAKGSAPPPPTFEGPVPLQDETPPKPPAKPIDLNEGAPKF